uniref:Metalloendopeptidase n=1 Tax=Pachycerianthus borealis TaxID=2736680 RepID=A0A7G7WYP8_9CNID|nr:toxin candidate TRINITY_DN27008_c0_g1_i1 [Pachycerianthus borealis]
MLLLVISLVAFFTSVDLYPVINDAMDVARAEENLRLHLFEGDIKLTNQQKFLLSHHDQHEIGDSRAMVRNSRMLWEDKLVPYSYNDNLDGAAVDMVQDAIREWEMNTCLRFKERTDELDYVEFVLDEGCSSTVGMYGGPQTITMGNPDRRCKVGNIIHEIGHTIGFFHEHSRPDRDEFVKIVFENIMSGFDLNFEKLSLAEIDSQNVPYDYESIMHYPRRVFTTNGEPTVIPIKEPDVYIGQRIALSDLDVLQANVLYTCPDLNEDRSVNDKMSSASTLKEKGVLWTKRTKGVKSCSDSHSEYVCSFIKKKGYCHSYPNIVRKICTKTCKLCSS